MKLKNIFRSVATTIAAIAITMSPQAQTFNLVPNSGFEDTNIKKLRAYGQMEDVSVDWFSATDVPADIYGDGAKGEKVGIPENKYGNQDLKKGKMASRGEIVNYKSVL